MMIPGVVKSSLCVSIDEEHLKWVFLIVKLIDNVRKAAGRI